MVSKRRGRRAARRSNRLIGCLFVVPAIALVGILASEAQTGNFGPALLAGLLAAFVLGLPLLRLARRRRRARTLEQLLLLSPSEFEVAVAGLLRDLGYRDVRRTGRAGDLAADITCRDPRGRSVVVQCKRYKSGSRIGSPAIQHFLGMQAIHHQAERGIYVTTSSFTRAAQDLAHQHDLELVDGDVLSRLMRTNRG